MGKRTSLPLTDVAVCLALAALWALLAVPGTALAGKPQRDVPVIVAFDDLPTDGVLSDGRGPYSQADRGFICRLSSGTGGLNFGNINQSAKKPRTLFLDLSQVISLEGSECAPPVLSAEDPDRGLLGDVLLQVGIGENLSNMEVGPPIYVAETRLRFSVKDQNWRLVWGFGSFRSGVGEWCEGPRVKVVRESEDVWRFETTTAYADGPHEAWLYQDDPNHPPSGAVFCGKFDVPFGFTAVRMPKE